MNFILYQGDGVSIRDAMYNMSYNHMRSHNYLIFQLARALGIEKVLDGNPGIQTKIYPGTDIFYTLKEFKEYKLQTPALSDYNGSVGILFHTQVYKENYRALLKAVSSCDYFIYYMSDSEFTNDYYAGTMFLDYIRKNPNDILSKYFHSRCILILTGFQFLNHQVHKYLDIPTVYIPQIINPNIPRIKCRKSYDVWMINVSPAHKKIADELVKVGIKPLVLTQNKEYTQNVDYIECKGQGVNLDVLLSGVSLCKYYLGSYPLMDNNDYKMDLPYSTWSHTSKVLESYYSNTYWISTNKNLRQCIDLIKSDQWKHQDQFNKFVEDNFSFENFRENFDLVVDICKKCIG